MKKYFLLIVCFNIILINSFINAQNVGINSTGASPADAAALDIDIQNKGVLIPRVALTETNVYAPVTGTPVVSLLIYNTATAGVSPTNVIAGYYYWDGSQWVRLFSGPESDDWKTTGNTGTNTTTNFIGTIDNVGLKFRTNNTDRMTIFPNGSISVNYPWPDANRITVVENNGTSSGISSTTNAGGSKAGVSGSTSFVGTSNLAFNNPSQQSFGVVGTCSYGYGIGVLGYAGEGSYFGVSAPAFRNGIVGVSKGQRWTRFTTIDVGVLGNGSIGIGGVSVGLPATNRLAGSFIYDLDDNLLTQETTGPNARIAGYNTSTTNYFGGYFSDGTNYSYVATNTGGINYKIIGTGSVSTIVENKENEIKVMFAPEAPEIVFQDYGVGTLVNGKANIIIDPTLANNIYVDEKHPLKVIVQLEGECNGVYVTNKSLNGFSVVELAGGQSNVSFSYILIASRKDDVNDNGIITSKHVGVRFPDAPVKIDSENYYKLELGLDK